MRWLTTRRCGGDNDRVPRAGESLVEEFRPLSLGAVEVADVRAVELVRR